jgi:16S rRNA (cytosine967-C5)-methyltransferase
MSPARRTAFEILLLVERGGFAADLLHARTAGLSPADAALAYEITLGCLRRQPQLDWRIERLSGRAASRLDPEVRIALRIGLYQLHHLDRVPPHAAVSESVELVKRSRKRSAAGLVNAVLRKAPQPVTWPDRATELCLPAWMLERWERHYGREAAERMARAFLEPPQTSVRITPAGARIQDLGAQSIVPLLDLRPGLRVLDLCAAPGNKTAQAMESGAWVVAADVHPRRLAGLKTLGCPLVVLDGTRTLPFRKPFDRILVDAPCSGTGTLDRNPEIKWRLKPEDLPRLHKKQVRLLSHALKLLAPGGRLVYSTCSLEPEENEAVVEEVLGGPPAFWAKRLPGFDPGDGFFAAVIGST